MGATWILSGLRPDQRFIGVEKAGRLREAAERICDREDALVLAGDWREILRCGPFELAFVDVAEAKDGGAEEVVDSLSIGGIAILDDFTPEDCWPESWRGKPDWRRERWLDNCRLVSVEVGTSPGVTAVLATRTA